MCIIIHPLFVNLTLQIETFFKVIFDYGVIPRLGYNYSGYLPLLVRTNINHNPCNRGILFLFFDELFVFRCIG